MRPIYIILEESEDLSDTTTNEGLEDTTTDEVETTTAVPITTTPREEEKEPDNKVLNNL